MPLIIVRHVLQGDVTGCIGLLEEVVMQGRELGQFVTDLTWYLRNLLLVKSSDDIENVIDVSSDNLARMREEADLLETAAIMRYIRIFSELSGQIKYAAQKRILIEIALIKLCRPSMEKTMSRCLSGSGQWKRSWRKELQSCLPAVLWRGTAAIRHGTGRRSRKNAPLFRKQFRRMYRR